MERNTNFPPDDEDLYPSPLREKFQGDVLPYLRAYGVEWSASFEDMTMYLTENDRADAERRQEIADRASTQVLRVIAQGDNLADLRGAYQFFAQLQVGFNFSDQTWSQLHALHARFRSASIQDITYIDYGEDRATADRRILRGAGYAADDAEELLTTMRLYRGIVRPLRDRTDTNGQNTAFKEYALPLFAPPEQLLLIQLGQRPPRLPAAEG